jgi:hypothetical protein
MDFSDVVRRLGGVAPIGGTAEDACIPLEESELEALEAFLGVSLPDAYRAFLATYGGCSFGPTVGNYSIVHPWIEAIPSHVSDAAWTFMDSFYGARRMPHLADRLIWQLECFRDRMPQELIPIVDCGGNKLCLAVRGDVSNRVYYWDAATEPEDEEDYLKDYGHEMPREVKWQNIFLVANSFEEFLMSLRRVDE